MWIIYALMAAGLWATVNYVDKYIVTYFSKGEQIGSLVLYSAFIGFPFCTIIYLTIGNRLFMINPLSLLLIIIAGLIYILALIPYLHGLAKDEVSSVIPQFMLVPIFGLILEYFLGELKISTSEIIGAIFIITGVIAINVEKTSETITIKKDTLGYMATASLLIALNAFVFKYISIEENDFWLSAFWQYFGFNIAGLLIFTFNKKYRDDFINVIYENGFLGIGVNALGEIVAVLGNLAFYYATLKAALPIVQITAEGFQPIFVFLIGILITMARKMHAHKNKIELLVGKVEIKNFYILGLMIIGLIMINIVTF